MRKKILMVIGVVALMAAILSVSAFAADAGTQITNYGVITVLLEKLTLNMKALFNTIDAVYMFFANLFA